MEVTSWGGRLREEAVVSVMVPVLRGSFSGRCGCCQRLQAVLISGFMPRGLVSPMDCTRRR